jgi:nicotinate-nucleotide adenylyltransferase
MRLGVLGGTFDPIHCGHLDAAAAAVEAAGLERVLFLPSHVPPHRSRAPLASAYHRFAMTAIAVLGRDRFAASDLELARPGPSYSVQTLRALHDEGWSPTQLFFIVGVDAFAEIATWHDYPDLLDASHFLVVTRPGHAAGQLRARLPALAARLVHAEPVESFRSRLDRRPTTIGLVDARTTDVSSTEVRRRVAAHEPVGGLVPEPVEHYIRQHRLYESRVAASQLHGQA